RRASRGVTPTAAGRELAQSVATHVDALEGALDTSLGALDSIGETVHIGGPEEFLSELVLPELLPQVEEGLRVRMFFGTDTPIVAKLAAGELDLAILTADLRQRGVETQQLCFEYLELVGTPKWRDRLHGLQEGPAGADLLRGVPIAAYDEDLPLVREYWQSVFASTELLRGTLVANGLRACLQFARRDAGITVLPSHTAAAAIAQGDLVRLLEPAAPPRSMLYLAWRSGSLRRVSLARVHEGIRSAAEAW
ncbi:MAG: substrate-binding domain-containing protein, partial [Thermoleophilia bacterium]|nr:substrate-binding domain-containing protein [Thermoleophilia bacterium]